MYECNRELSENNSVKISNRLAIPYDMETRQFLFPFLTNNYYFSWPDLKVTQESKENIYNPFEKSIFTKVLVLRYLLYATPFSPNGEFRSFRELPSGELYYRQFQGRCILKLTRKYGSRLETFRKVMETLNAIPVSAGFPAAFGTYDLAEIGDICINTFLEVEKTIRGE